jgi:hypothetical protein
VTATNWLMEILNRDDGRRSPSAHCMSVEDGLDGFYVHHESCRMVGHGDIGSSDCVGGFPVTYRGPARPWMDRQGRP